MVSYRTLTSFIWRFIKRQKRTFFLVGLLDACAWPLDILVWPYIFRVVIDIFSQFEGDKAAAWQALQAPIIGAICLVLVVETMSRTMGFLLGKALPKLQADMRMEMFDHIQHHSPRYFNEKFAGSLANKIVDMTTQVETIFKQLFWPLLPSFVACIAATLILWSIHPIFASILFGWIILHLTAVILFTRPIDKYGHRHGEARSVLIGKIVDSLTNNLAVSLFYRFKMEKEALLPFQKEEEQTNVQANYYVQKMCCVNSALFFFLFFICMNGALIYLWLHNQITTGQVAQVFITTSNILAIMWAVSQIFPVVFQAFGIAKQAYTVMLDPQDIGDKQDASSLKVSGGEIVFKDVTFRYGEKDLFVDKNVKIRPQEKVGLVGFTGAGKSTFINLILRLFPLEKGKILIDGQELADVTLESLRSQIALIPQDPVLFHRTLKENIAYGKPEATDDEIALASKLAHCDEFISNIPLGYEAKVGERGTKLSGGEKQRIAIARAILADAPILILDEATSSLDSVTERYIQESLNQLMKNRTTLVIAHRLSTLSHMDRILVFDKGKIVEDGSHASLLEKNGLYAKMWKMQVDGFLPANES